MAFISGIDLSLFPEKKGVYIVGGSIRDHLLGKLPLDFDIVVSENPERFSEKLANNLSGHRVQIGHKMPIIRVVAKNQAFDISQIKGNNIFEDLAQRDFTINAMALSIESGQLIDCAHGKTDLHHKTVRMVSDGVFKQDPVRLLRAFRIAAVLNFEIEPKTIEFIRKEADLLWHCAAERIREELCHLFRSSRSYGYLEQMARTGLLFELMPELKHLKGCRQNRHHTYDVFDHTMKAYFHMEALLNNFSRMPANVKKPIRSHISVRNKALMKYAILLHDIGKPATRTKDGKGNIHFYGHAVKGAEMVETINKKLKIANRDMDYIDDMIRHHNRPRHLFKLYAQGQLTPKAQTRFFIHCGRRAPDIMLHSIADHQGKVPDPDKSFEKFIFKLLSSFYEFHLPKTTSPPLLNGKDLIQQLGLRPSPLFKTILDQVEEARLSDQIMTKEDAVSLAKKILKRHTGSNS